MSVSEKLKSAVTTKDIVAIRDCLWSRIVLDSNFTKGFPESWKYCLDNGISESELYQEHDGREINLEPTGENFDLLCGQLRTNFSKERLDKIKEIGRKLYPVSEEKPVNQNPATQNSNHRTKTSPNSSSTQDDGSAGLLIAGLAIGALAGGLLGGLLFGKAVAAGIGAIAGAAVGGTVGAKVSRT